MTFLDSCAGRNDGLRRDCPVFRRRRLTAHTRSVSLRFSHGANLFDQSGGGPDMAGALEHIRVIDFGQYISGPLAGMLLADQGADVIRVDPPGGPRWKTPANSTWNRGKRSITLDLKRADDSATARSLIQSADVVVENFRPGTMDRLRLGPEEMTRANPAWFTAPFRDLRRTIPGRPCRLTKELWERRRPPSAHPTPVVRVRSIRPFPSPRSMGPSSRWWPSSSP